MQNKNIERRALLPAILLIGLVMSMGFGSAFLDSVSAKSDVGINAKVIAKVNPGHKVVSIDEINNEAGIDNETDSELGPKEIRKASMDIDTSVSEKAKESTFAQVSIGQGWAISSDTNASQEGSFVRLFWVEKTFVNSTTDENQTNETNQTDTNQTETTKARGTLKLGSDLYGLVMTSESDNSLTFDVMSSKNTSVGTLDLTADNSLLGFTVWTGTLSLDSGQTYSVHVATMNNKVTPSSETGDSEKQPGLQGNLNAEAQGQGKKIGLFARIRAFFGRK